MTGNKNLDILLIVIFIIVAGAAGYFILRSSVIAPSGDKAGIEIYDGTGKDLYGGAPPLSTKPAKLSDAPSSTSGEVVIINSLIPAGETSVAYNAFITAAGGEGNYTWKVLSGTLPVGLKTKTTLDCSQLKDRVCRPGFQIYGTPTKAGVYNFRAAVTDKSKTVFKDFELVIRQFVNLEILTVILPDGKIGENYKAEVVGSGGTDSYSWVIMNGSLPPGLSFTPRVCDKVPCKSPADIVGTPNGGGKYTFTVVLTSGSKTVVKELSINIK